LLNKGKREFDPKLYRTDENSNYLYQSINGPVKIYLGSKEKGKTPLARFEVAEGKMVEVEGVDLEAKKAKIESGQVLRYANAQENTDITYKIIENGLKEDIIIKKPPQDQAEFSFIISYPEELEIKERTPNELTFYEKEGGYLFHFVKPFMEDKKGARSEEIKIQVRRVIPENNTQTNNHPRGEVAPAAHLGGVLPGEHGGNDIIKYRVTFIPNRDWLADSERKYPIIVDPTIIHDTSSEFNEKYMNRMEDGGSEYSPKIELGHQELNADIHTVGLWHMNETSGSSVADSSGVGNTGTATGTTIVDGIMGKGRNFRDTATDYISTSNLGSSSLPSSISAWIYINNCTTVNPIFKEKSHATIYYGTWLNIDTSCQLMVSFGGGTGEGQSYRRSKTSSVTVPTGKWVHVAGVIRGSENMEIYIDGVGVSGTYTGTGSTTIASSSDGAKIGYEDNYATTFNGIIDEIIFARQALTPEEIKVQAQRRPYGTYTSPVIDFGDTPASLNSLSWIDNITPPDAPSTDYDQVKPILIDNTQNSSALTDYQVKVHVDYSSEMQTDFDDLRFSNSVGTTMPYWIEEQNDGVEAEVWVEVDSITASNWTTIFMFYGYASAGAGAGVGDTDPELSTHIGTDIEFETRTGSTSSPSNDWEEWKPTSGETTIASMDSDQSNWIWSNTAPMIPVSKADETSIKIGGSGSMKVTFGQPQSDANTVGLWHFEETGTGIGTTFYDSSGNSNHGIGTSVPAVTDGFFGKARDFDGTNDYVDLNDYDSLEPGASSYSVCLWVMLEEDADQNYNYLLSKYYGATGRRSWAFRINSAGTDSKLKFSCTNDCTNDIRAMVTDSNTGITAGTWNHVCFTKSDTSIVFYHNGQSMSSSGTTHSTVCNTATQNLYLGTYQSTAGHLNGTVDEVRISNIARTAEEIAEDYRAGRDHHLEKTVSSADLSDDNKLPFWIAADRPGTFLETYIGEDSYDVYGPDANTVGLWHLEEKSGSGAYILDSSGNANHGTPSGPDFTQGKIGKGRSFNGSSDYVDVGNATNYAVPASTEDMTLEAWVSTDVVDSNRHRIININKATGNTAMSIHLESTDNALAISYLNTSNTWVYLSSGVVPTVGQWYYVAGTKDNGNVRIYVNGVEKATASDARQYVLLTGEGSTSSVGKVLDAGQYWDGLIDEVRISDTARTADEIRQAYQYGLRTHQVTVDFVTNLQSTYLGDCAGSPSICDNLLVNNPWGTDELTDTLTIGDTIIVSENVGGTAYISQETVTNITNTSSTYGTVEIGNGSTSLSSKPPSGFSVNATVFKWQKEYWDLKDISEADRNAITKLGVRISDASQGATVYLDNFKSNTNYLYQPFGNTIASTPNRYFQYRGVVTTNNGGTPRIDRVNVNYTLSGDEKDGRPVAEWKFDEGYGSTAYDETIGGHDGTMVNMNASDWTDGYMGKALEFGGTDEYLSVTNSIDVNFGDRDMSISTFVNIGSTGSTYAIIDKYSSSKGYQLKLNSTGKAVFTVGDGTYTPSVTSNTAVNDGLWHSILAVRDKGNNLYLYIDGVFDNSASDTANNIDSTVDVVIGRDSAGGNDYSGNLDELNLYDYALSASQAKVVYNKGSSAVLGANKDVGGSAPVGFWKFDAGVGSSAYDSSGQGNDGTLGTGNSAPTWTTNGKIGNALDFDGNDYVDIGSTASGVQTVEFWINPESTTTSCIDLNGSAYITISSGAVVATGFTSPSIYVSGVGSTAVVADQWQHIAVTTATPITASAITIGKANSAYLSGRMDHVKMYDYTRSVAQIHADMGGSPISYWKFNEGVGTTAYDEMDNNNDGVLGAGNSAPNWVAGKYGRGLDFDGNDYLSIGSTISGVKTVELWVKPSSTTASLIDLNGSAYITLNSGTVTATGFTSPSIYVSGVGSTAVVADQWQHVAVTTATPITASAITIGKANSAYLSGEMDEVKIYNYTLTADEVKMEYNRGAAVVLGDNIDVNVGGSEPVGFWKFDEDAGTTSSDSSGNELTATFAGGAAAPTWTSNGKVGNALSFDGGDYASTSTSNILSGASGLTVEGWFKSNSFSHQQTIAAQGALDAIANYVFELVIDTGGAGFHWNVSDGSSQLQFATTYTFSTDTWYHLIGVWDGTNMTTYVNGVQTDTTSTSVPASLNTATKAFYIGQEGRIASHYFDGMLDHIKIYNYARTTRQIAFDYNKGKPLAYWKLNEKVGATAYDEYGQDIDLTLYNMEEGDHLLGKVGWGLDFGGTNEYAASGNTSIIAGSGMTYADVGWGAWVNPSASPASTTLIHKNNELRLTIDADSKANCTIYSGSWQTAAVSSSAIPQSQWSHLFCTYDDSNIKIYVNGVLAGTQAETDDITGTNATALNLARDSADSGYFVGKIDEVKIYGYARSADEVKMDYNQGAAAFR